MKFDASIRDHKDYVEMMKVLLRKLHIFLDRTSDDDSEVFKALLDWIRLADIQMTESYWLSQDISLISI
jgi:hypothetical protein